MIVEKLEKELVETRQGTLVPVQAITEGKEFAVVGFDEWSKALKVRLSEKAQKGKANQELARALGAIFNAEVEIVSGERQRKKRLLVHAEKGRVLECLSALWAKP